MDGWPPNHLHPGIMKNMHQIENSKSNRGNTKITCTSTWVMESYDCPRQKANDQVTHIPEPYIIP